MSARAEAVAREWLRSCLRGGKLSRNTIAVGIVVLHALRRKCPLDPSDILSDGGEIKGARSGLPRLLDHYGIPGFLKEATTRQVHQDGQRLLQELDFGRVFSSLSPEDRDSILEGLIGILLDEANAWLARQNLKVLCSREDAPGSWVNSILEMAQGRSGGRVEQHLVGAKLSKAHPNADIPAHPGAAADAQTGRAGDFQVGTTVYHVTAAPGEAVVQKAKDNYHAGLHPVLLVPAKDKDRSAILVDLQEMTGKITVLAIEDFFSVNILEMSDGQRPGFLDTLRQIIGEYNRRIEQCETDMSLKIDVD